MSQLRLSWAAASAALAFALLGCGGSDETYYIPADNQIRPFAAPDTASDGAAGGDAAEDDWGSTSDEGEADSAAPAPAAAASPAAPSSADASGKGAAVKPGKAGKSEKPAAAKGGAGTP